MKNKKILYILLALAIIIWALIFYRIFKFLNKTPEVHYSYNYQKKYEKEEIKKDTFFIIADYRDPFLNKILIPKVKNEGKPKVNNKKDNSRTKRRVKKIKWPVIKYGGVISSKDNNKKIALIKINDKDYLMEVNSESEEIKLINIFTDSIKVVYKDEKKTIIKE
ncbi:MAG: hypothetical protein KAT68_02920 [Bacteroidales bacterium]|nr:hypothetical protein [Bacteroidales bacterium]